MLPWKRPRPPQSSGSPLDWGTGRSSSELAELLRPGTRVAIGEYAFSVTDSLDFKEVRTEEFPDRFSDNWDSRRVFLDQGLWFEFHRISMMGGVWWYVSYTAPAGAWPRDSVSFKDHNNVDHILFASAGVGRSMYRCSNGRTGVHFRRWYSDNATNQQALLEKFDDGNWMLGVSAAIRMEDITIL